MVVTQENSGTAVDPRCLLSGARRGDASQVGQLLDAYRNYLRILADAHLDRKLRGRVSPSDIVQETMLEAYRDFQQFRGRNEGEFLGWLRQILAHTLARIIEKHVLTKKRDVRRDVSLKKIAANVEQSTMQLSCVLNANRESPSSAARRQERAVILANVMSELSVDQQQVLILRNMQGLKFTDVAKQMNRSVPACQMLWMRALKRLRELYEGRDEG